MPSLEVAHAAALVVAPGDGDFADDVFEFAGDEEDLGIEAPALDRLEAEDDLRCLAFEGLETALRVFVRQAHDGAGDPVETAAEELAIERLVNCLAGAVHPARTDGNVGAVADGVEEALGFFHRGGEIGVGEHDDIAGGLQETVADRVAFAAVAWVLHQVKAGMLDHPALNDGCGVVL